MQEGKLSFGGILRAKKISAKTPGLLWKLSNNLRPSYIKAWLGVFVFGPIANYFGLMTGYGELSAILFRANGEVIDYGVISRRLVTDAGVAFMVDDWDVNTASATNDITTLKYHGCGTGVGAEAVGDTALGTESTTALNPDSTRATGTQSQPTANQLRSIGTLTFDASAAITEHGLFSQSATGGGTLWDRSVFTAINVVSGDSIQFTYTATLTSGG